MKKQIIAKLLVLAMVLAMVPVTVLAASAAGSNLGYSANYGYYSIGKDTYVVNKPISGNKLALTVEGTTGYAIVNDSVIASFADLEKDGQMIVKLDGKVDRIYFTSSVKALSTLAANTEADLVFETNFATITFPNDLLAGLGNVGTSRIFMGKADNGASVIMEAAGEDVDTSSVKTVAVEAE